MSTAYESLTPREASNGSASRLFAFYANGSTRFYPGDGATLHFANRDVDTLTLPGLPSGFLVPGMSVSVSYKGETVFRGDVATIVESKGRGTDATQTVTCVGPWSKMQRLVYRQYWNSADGYVLSSRLVLNQSQSGAAQSLNSELNEIMFHGAAQCGFSPGTVSVSSQCLPFDECRDITVADAIKRELRFFPKAVVRFDYSSASPRLDIVKPSSAQASYVASVPKFAREFVYNAHPITGVDLEIEATGSVDGVEYRSIMHQKAGDTAAGNPDCLYATLQIRGASSSVTRQSFKSVTEDIPSDLNDAAWWKERHPRLANVASDAITISDGARSPSNYPRISAAIAGELEEAGLHCEVSKFTCRATIETTDDKEDEIFLTLNYLTTNAKGTAENPKTYTWTTDSSAESGESVPSGLAATILAERAGSLLSERMTIRLGDVFPKVGDAIVESDGTVFLQSFDVDCGSLTADLDFGVPDYLSPEDMVSLLSGFRNKCTASSSSIRSTGKPKGGDTVEMGAIPPLSSSEFAPGTKSRFTVATYGGSGAVKLDTTGAAPSLSVVGDFASVDLDLAKVPDECEGAFAFRSLKWKDKDGEEQEVHFVGCDDADLSDLSASDAASYKSAFHATPNWVEKNGGMFVDTITVDHGYYMVGGRTYSAGGSWTFTYTCNAVIALKLTDSGSGFSSPDVVLYGSLADAQAAQSSASAYVIPLYEMTNEESGILVDLRTMPQAQAFEFNLT